MVGLVQHQGTPTAPGRWGVPWKSWASAPNPAIGTSLGDCDTESHIVALEMA